jgi:two-component system nitrogen regulation sensor histidine kinase NtrY
MTFRTRLLAGFGVVVLLPLAVFGLGIRREMSRRITAESRERVAALVRAIDTDVTRAGDAVASRLAALKDALPDDNKFRTAALQGTDRAYVLDYAGAAMRVAGLDYLQILDDEGAVLSSGHFRNEYDRRAPIPPPDSAAIVRARTAEGSFLALIRADTLHVGVRRLTLVGGIAVDSLFLSRLSRDSDLVASLAVPGAAGEGPGTVVGELHYPYLDAENERGAAGEARIVVTQSLPLLDALQRDVNFWFGAAVLVTALVALLVAGWLSTRFSRPVTQMEHRAVLGDLARQVNHDIKNAVAPLRNVFRHLAQVARGEPAKLPHIFEERQGTVESSLTYLETLAANYARLSPKVDGRPADVNAVVREALRHASAATDHAELVTELPDGLPAVRADALVLRRVIENLVGNAVDSLEGRPGTVTVATAQGKGLVRITVGDTGRGMTKAELARAFDDFYTTKPGGTGLGLSIVRRLVLDSAGTLNVESEPGKGSRFIVELPTETGRSS